MARRTSYPEKEHRIASYNGGCRCEHCKRAGRDRGRRLRDAIRRADGRQPGDEMCPMCGMWFRPQGMGSHRVRCEADHRAV